MQPNKNDILSDSLPVNNKEGCNKLFIAYRQSVTVLDRGFIFDEGLKEENLMISVYIPDGVLDTTARTGANVMYWVEIYGDHTITTNFIQFKKIQDVLANLGGVVSFVKQALTMFFFFFNHYSLPFVVYQETFMDPRKLREYYRFLTKSSIKKPGNDSSVKPMNDDKKRNITMSFNPANTQKKFEEDKNKGQKKSDRSDKSKMPRELNLSSDDSNDGNEFRNPLNNKDPLVNVKTIFGGDQDLTKKKQTKDAIDKRKMKLMTRDLNLSLYRWICSSKKIPTMTSRANAIVMNKINREMDVSTYLRLREEVYLMRTMLFTEEEHGIFYPNVTLDQVFYTMKTDTNLLTDYYKYVKRSFIDEKLSMQDATRKDEIIKKYKGWRENNFKKDPKINMKPNLNSDTDNTRTHNISNNKVRDNNYIMKN